MSTRKERYRNAARIRHGVFAGNRNRINSDGADSRRDDILQRQSQEHARDASTAGKAHQSVQESQLPRSLTYLNSDASDEIAIGTENVPLPETAGSCGRNRVTISLRQNLFASSIFLAARPLP